ncbi:hypothetical protein [Streptomyces sp. DT203]|uniref:hypothetical protein n=1 Tax=Streptomyces sp. DT203 TaxID=3393424 RepID=UPI003CF6B0B4
MTTKAVLEPAVEEPAAAATAGPPFVYGLASEDVRRVLYDLQVALAEKPGAAQWRDHEVGLAS